MFILPFLKYLKPHLARIVLAVFCMTAVAFLSAFSIGMMVPALKVMVDLNPTRMTVPDQMSPDEEPPAGIALPDPVGADEPATETEPAVAAATEAAPAVEPLADREPSAVTHTDATSPPREAGAETGVANANDMIKQLSSRLIPHDWQERAESEISTRREQLRTWFETQAREDPLKLLYVFCGILILATLLKGAAEYLSNYHISHTFYFINLQLQEDVFRNVMSQDYLFFTKHSAGYLGSRIGSDSGAINGMLRKLISEGVQQPLNLIAFAGLLIWISPRLFLLVMLLFPPLGGMIWYFSKILKKNTRKQKKKIDEIGSATTESLFNVRLIKAMGTEQEEVDKYIMRRLQLFKYFMQRRLVKFASGPIMELMGTVAATGILLIGGYAIFGGGVNWIGQLHPIEFGAFLYALTKFYRPMKALSKAFMGFAVTKVAAERLMEMLSLQPVVMEVENPVPFDGLKDKIEFRDVCFRYGEKVILDHVNIEFPVGKIVAIVGETGSGKTSVANLLARLFDPTEGQILVDGIDMKEYRMADIRRRLGMVTQDTILFDDTIANNIAYGVDVSHMPSKERKAAIAEAARIANADEFIRQLDGGKGYRTEIGPTGCRLSGGQAQRIAIARAVFRDPQLLILDEATSALDSQTQASVQEAMNHALQNRTALVISHRLSTIRNADRIYVLEGGRVVESGTFDDLMAGETMFRSLYQAESLAETA